MAAPLELGTQIRTAIESSAAGSTAAAFPPAFTEALVRHQLLSPEQAFERTLQSFDSGVTTVTLGVLAEHLPPVLLERAAKLVACEPHEDYRCRAAGNLVPVLWQRGERDLVVKLARACSEPLTQGHVMLYLAAQYLALSDESSALDHLFEIQNPFSLNEGLRVLASRLSPRARQIAADRLLVRTRTIGNHMSAGLLYLAPWLAPAQRKIVVSNARDGFFSINNHWPVIVRNLLRHDPAVQQEIYQELQLWVNAFQAAKPQSTVTLPLLLPAKPEPIDPHHLRESVEALFDRGRTRNAWFGDELVSQIVAQWDRSDTSELIRSRILSWGKTFHRAEPIDYGIAAIFCENLGEQIVSEGLELLSSANCETLERLLRQTSRPLRPGSGETATGRAILELGLWYPEYLPQRHHAGKLLEIGASRLLRTVQEQAEMPVAVNFQHHAGRAIALLAPYLNAADLETATDLALQLPGTPAWIFDLLREQSGSREAALQGLSPFLLPSTLARAQERLLQPDRLSDYTQRDIARLVALACDEDSSYVSKWSEIPDRIRSLVAEKSSALLEAPDRWIPPSEIEEEKNWAALAALAGATGSDEASIAQIRASVPSDGVLTKAVLTRLASEFKPSYMIRALADRSVGHLRWLDDRPFFTFIQATAPMLEDADLDAVFEAILPILKAQRFGRSSETVKALVCRHVQLRGMDVSRPLFGLMDDRLQISALLRLEPLLSNHDVLTAVDMVLSLMSPVERPAVIDGLHVFARRISNWEGDARHQVWNRVVARMSSSRPEVLAGIAGACAPLIGSLYGAKGLWTVVAELLSAARHPMRLEAPDTRGA